MSRTKSKGRRYDGEPKLNIKKVIAVIVAIAVIVMFIIGIKTLLTNDVIKTVAEEVTTSYYPVYTNEKWGVIDETGTMIIEPVYDEMITIPNPKCDIFIALKDVDYGTGTYKTEVLNKEAGILFTNYDLVEAIENSDNTGSIWYEEGVLRVSKEGKYGLIDFSGKEILPVEYDKIQSLPGTKNSIIITKGTNVGLCDNKGSIIVNPDYKEIKSIDDDYKNGYIVVNSDNKYGVIDFTKSVILEEKYDDIKQTTSNGIYIVKEDSKLKLITKEKTILEDKFTDANHINGEYITFISNNKYGIMDTKGETKIDAEYDDLQYIFDEYYIAKKDGKYGIINTSNEKKLPIEYQKINYNKEVEIIEAQKENINNSEIYNNKLEKKLEGNILQVNSDKAYIRVRVGEEYKYYNYKLEETQATEVLTQNTIFLSKSNGKYGYVNKAGTVVVDYVYDDATEQNELGYAAVKKDGKWGALDKNGSVVVDTLYELEDNLLIDFIGKWHIGEDINSYYYTDK